ncbi:hypothetical protein BaRGS_00001037 [Batillaria attramentaria]|uniref:Uncharacterized protein n=1 Tax=Batillaria attramentaria TaxID=370345 RepID=A0ABD0M941_9CAEN
MNAVGLSAACPVARKPFRPRGTRPGPGVTADGRVDGRRRRKKPVSADIDLCQTSPTGFSVSVAACPQLPGRQCIQPAESGK